MDANRMAKHMAKAKRRKLRRLRGATVERDDPGYPPAVQRWLAEEAARRGSASP